MNSYQGRVAESLRREQGWLRANPQYVQNNPSLGHQLETLDEIVSRIAAHAAAQETQHAQTMLISTDEPEKRRELMSHHMLPIAKVARALLGTVPGIGVLVMPKSNVSTPEIVTAATAMAQKAEIYKALLIESGLPADFIEQLQAATTVLKSSIDSRGLARASRVAATRGLESELALGRRVASIIDAVVTRAIRSEPAKLAEWQQLKRVTLKSGAVRAPLELVERQSTPADARSIPVQTSSSDVVAEPGSVVKAA
jgi:hypothetical protein